MSLLVLYTRSFHPDANFGAGGLGFEGDNRGFSGDPGVSARIYHRVEIDLESGRLNDPICDSDPSANKILTTAAAPVDDVAEVVVDQVIPGPGPRINIPEVPPFENDYSEGRKKPRHEEEARITPYRPDGDQTVDMFVKYAGKNFAFPWADTDAGHGVLGGPNSTEERDDTGSGSTAGGWIPWNGVVPDLDVTHRLTIQIDRRRKRASVLSTIAGDGFPNCEAFLYDASNNLLMLATHVRTGTAVTQLPGGRLVQMTHSEITLDWNGDDSFGTNIDVEAATDFMSYGRTVIADDGTMTRDSWNTVHISRDASGNFMRQLQDHLPVGILKWPTRDDLLDLGGDHESPSASRPGLFWP